MDEETKRRLAEELEEHNKPPDPPFIPFKEFEPWLEAYLEDAEKAGDKLHRIGTIQRALGRQLGYVNKRRKEIRERTLYKRSNWTFEVPFMRDENGKLIRDRNGKKIPRPKKKLSDLFWPVYAEMWENTLTLNNCKQMTQEKKLSVVDPYGNGKHERYHVLVIPDVDLIARNYRTTVDNVRKMIQKWLSGVEASLIKVGMTTRPRDGGRAIYSMGYWTPGNPGRRVAFFSEGRSKEWLWRVLYHF